MHTKFPWLLVVLLTVALVATNAWWLYQAIDIAVTEKFREQERWNRERGLEDALAVIPHLARGKAEAEVLQAFRGAFDDPTVFSKDGVTVVEFLILRFDDHGKLAAVGTDFYPNGAFPEN